MFLARGFDGASIGEIAEAARAGKATIYARYPDKEALFAAAFLRRLSQRNARLETFAPTGATVEERLRRHRRGSGPGEPDRGFSGPHAARPSPSRAAGRTWRGRSMREARERGGGGGAIC